MRRAGPTGGQNSRRSKTSGTHRRSTRRAPPSSRFCGRASYARLSRRSRTSSSRSRPTKAGGRKAARGVRSHGRRRSPQDGQPSARRRRARKERSGRWRQGRKRLRFGSAAAPENVELEPRRIPRKRRNDCRTDPADTGAEALVWPERRRPKSQPAARRGRSRRPRVERGAADARMATSARTRAASRAPKTCRELFLQTHSLRAKSTSHCLPLHPGLVSWGYQPRASSARTTRPPAEPSPCGS